MFLEIILEEESARSALELLVPKIVREIAPDLTMRFHVARGKGRLMKQLRGRLTGFAREAWSERRILVLIDEDRSDCHRLKAQLEQAARDAGLTTRSGGAAFIAQFEVLNRIAVEELEAWFFGDMHALRKAYPKIPATLAKQERFRDPDRIGGGTAEALERILRDSGDHPVRLEKNRAAREIAQHMDPYRNTSHSFQVFRDGLRDLVKTAE